MYCGMPLLSFPRRQKDFRFDLVDPNGVSIGGLWVPNPVHGPFPEWHPQPLPQTQTNGPITVTLSGLKPQLNQPWPRIDAKWRVTSSDPGWMDCHVRFHTFEDATGNRGQVLGSQEPAWKLRAWVYRERLKYLPPDERMVLTNLAIPTAGNFVSIDQTNTCAGVGIKVLLLGGAGQLVLTNGGGRFMLPLAGAGGTHSTSDNGNTRTESWDTATPFFLVEAQNVQIDDDILFRVRDETGREIKAEANGYDPQPNGARIYKPTFDPSETAKFLTLEIMVNRPLEFEFVVNPADVHAPRP
jgi:hypothetical protein